MYRSERNTRKHKPIFREMTSASARRRPGGSIRVQGQGYSKVDTDAQPPDAAAASSGSSLQLPTMASNGLAADWDTEAEAEDDGNPMLLDELSGINRTLEKQIETLRLRLDFDTRHHDAEKHALLVETGAKLKSKAEEIDLLKQQVTVKDTKMKDIEKQNAKKSEEIITLRREIESLNNEVVHAKSYANDLMSQMSTLTKEREQLEREGVFGDREQEVTALRREVSDLRNNLHTLESELTKARELVATQGNKLKFADSDKKSLQLKFKEELAKVSHSMRMEVERMRDVMKKQWEEMRALREQNFSMSKDIKDIRSLLINGCLDDDGKMQQQEDQDHGAQSQGHMAQGQSPRQHSPTHALSLPQTARGSKQGYSNGYNMAALKPSLPVLNKDSKKTAGRRK
ncbi:keratin, type I cytoskeletal 42-like isoform X2 [Mya arenaria]|uniref:keratin, type I cytoskeletal 42-like isoform X2 n=1 Tax=Mya arenaria TaxID=6604 RepID=UPI0022E37376|nr:keratin, type I cytoskeletal 42-like isoform X2 [Mya arenaria]